MRSVIAFPCEGDQLLATLDAAPGATGLLIVSGGAEVRAGSHRGMALLARRLAARGVPVFRFDRRGVGDSGGENRGWGGSAPDIAAAAAAFRAAQPQVTRLVGLGNCDAAAALAFFGRDCGLDALVLTNPWLGDDAAPPPASALRRHYARRLLDPAAWRRIDLGAIRQLFAKPSEQPLATRWRQTLGTLPTTVVLAAGDRTAQLYRATIRATPANLRTVVLPTASHSFADAGEALADAVLRALTPPLP